MSDTFLSKLRESEFVDFRFTDLHGTWHHMAIPTSQVDDKILNPGIPFDGSSLKGWKGVHESDMLLKPDTSKIIKDPFASHSTAIVFCDVYDPRTNAPYGRDPRSIAKLAEAYLKESGIADTAYFGSEAEFFVFDQVKFHAGTDSSFFHLHSDELPASNSSPSQGYRPSQKGGYMPCGPVDTLIDARNQMMNHMSTMGLIMERHHHEVATAQHEIGFQFSTLTNNADAIQIYKYVVHNVAFLHNKTATFMPKPLYGDNGSGMHVHQSLWSSEKPLFAGDSYANLSKTALYYIGGIIKHAKALNAFTNPTTNSYKRLIPGFEAPVICAYSAGNRSAACRIPMVFNDKARRVEVRFPDATANTYLAFAAMLMAGLDGIKNQIDPGAPADHDLYEDPGRYPTVCGSLREALKALENDHAFLEPVFNKDMIEAYLATKWLEVYRYEHAPHPMEYVMYYNS